MGHSLSFRWIGTNSIELSFFGQTIWMDPFFSRLGLYQVIFGHVRPAPTRITKYIQSCEYIFVSHAHYDHMMDVPFVASATSAKVYGSGNVCKYLRNQGIPEQQIQQIKAGEQIEIGDIVVTVSHQEHPKILSDKLLTGTIQEKHPNSWRYRDLILDEYLGFHFQSEHVRISCFDLDSPSDALFISPYREKESIARSIGKNKPKLVVPVHWDYFFSPLSQPLRPIFTNHCLSKIVSNYTYLEELETNIKRSSPQSEFLIPELNKQYILKEENNGLTSGLLISSASVGGSEKKDHGTHKNH